MKKIKNESLTSKISFQDVLTVHALVNELRNFHFVGFYRPRCFFMFPRFKVSNFILSLSLHEFTFENFSLMLKIVAIGQKILISEYIKINLLQLRGESARN